MSTQEDFYIGTSGWTYDHWKGGFYPVDLAKSRWFGFYAQHFNAVEVNATFYRTFQDQTYVNWKARAPRDFGYVLKTPKKVTHHKLLRDVEGDIQAFCRSAALLGDTFQMILLQVAPNQPYDPGLLREALQAFPDPGRVAVEFRHKRWYNPEIEKLLTSLGVVFCNVDSPEQKLTEILTGERTYLRLHGRERWYTSSYSDSDLHQMLELIQKFINQGAKRVFIFFNNDFGCYAPSNALFLQKLLAE